MWLDYWSKKLQSFSQEKDPDKQALDAGRNDTGNVLPFSTSVTQLSLRLEQLEVKYRSNSRGAFMRSMLFTVLTLTSLSAIACPNLAGTYSACRSTTGNSTGTKDVIVTQTLKNGVTTYVIASTDEGDQERNTTTAIADGLTYSETRQTENGEMVSTATVSCQGDKLIMSNMVIISGETFFSMTAIVSKNGKTMEQELSGSFLGNPLQDKLICE